MSWLSRVPPIIIFLLPFYHRLHEPDRVPLSLPSSMHLTKLRILLMAQQTFKLVRLINENYFLHSMLAHRPIPFAMEKQVHTNYLFVHFEKDCQSMQSALALSRFLQLVRAMMRRLADANQRWLRASFTIRH